MTSKEKYFSEMNPDRIGSLLDVMHNFSYER